MESAGLWETLYPFASRSETGLQACIDVKLRSELGGVELTQKYYAAAIRPGNVRSRSGLRGHVWNMPADCSQLYISGVARPALNQWKECFASQRHGSELDLDAM